MITICIPVYNFNIASLVNELRRQINGVQVPIEIIVIDDCSQRFKSENEKASEEVTYIELSKNIGRSKIRNMFLRFAQYPYLLFLDCDSLVDNPDFLANYLNAIERKPNVVCGGRVYENNKPKRNQMLSWKYGMYRESQPVEVRNQTPNKSFMTNNFLIDRNVLDSIKFDERITQYGHEDTLFGFSLKKKNIAITHIDNVIINGDVEENAAFLKKTNEGIVNLIQILNNSSDYKDLMHEISILRFYKKVRNMEGIINASFIVLKPLVVYLLKSGYVNLYLFDYYKLGFLIQNLRLESNKSIHQKLRKAE